MLTVAVIFAIGTSSTSLHTAFANSKINSLKEQKNEFQEKESEINELIKDKNVEISQIQAEQEQVDKEIKRLDLAVSDTELKIIEKEKEITAAELEIRRLQEEVKIVKERIEKRNEVLKDRARSYQENGRVTYIDVLLGAKSFGDFIDRIGAVATIVEADQGIIEIHKADQKMLEETQAEVETSLANLEKMLADLEAMKVSLSAHKAEKEKVMSSLAKQEEDMHAEMLDLEEESEILAAQVKAMEKAIKKEQERIAEQKRLAELAKKNGNTYIPPISDGSFTRPAAGYVSSGFGPRSLGNHYGIDIAKSGTVPIVSAADGVVIKSYYSATYGNAIFISHSIDGQIYTTVYAHLSSRSVSEGEYVSKGQQIGYMGNTGRSYGQHLHFELHKGPWNSAKSNAIDPVGIIPL